MYIIIIIYFFIDYFMMYLQVESNELERGVLRFQKTVEAVLSKYGNVGFYYKYKTRVSFVFKMLSNNCLSVIILVHSDAYAKLSRLLDLCM